MGIRGPEARFGNLIQSRLRLLALFGNRAGESGKVSHTEGRGPPPLLVAE